MARFSSFSVVKFAAHSARDERLNVGLIVFNDDSLDVHVARSMDKVRAISGAVEAQEIRNAIIRLAETDKFVRDQGVSNLNERFEMLRTLSPVELGPVGSFAAPSVAAYNDTVIQLLAQLVEPEPAPFVKKVRRSKLLTEIKSAFRVERVLAKKGESLSAHRVVAGLELAQGLSADLVLKNGAMHVIETIDAGAEGVSVRKVVSDIAVSALVLEQARMLFGIDQTKGRLVYDASNMMEAAAKPSLLAVQHQGTELINWASHDDRRKLITLITSLATPFELSRQQKSDRWINASSQSKLALN